MYWHYRKLVYKIIVNEGGYRITYFIAGYWIYSRPLSAYIVLNQPILLKNFPQKKSCWRTPVLRGKKMPNGGDAVFKLHSFDQFGLRQLVFSSMCFHFRHIKSWKLLKRREKNCKCEGWLLCLWFSSVIVNAWSDMLLYEREWVTQPNKMANLPAWLCK